MLPAFVFLATYQNNRHQNKKTGTWQRPTLPRVPPVVPSALEGLTAGFGMDPGVSPPLWPPCACFKPFTQKLQGKEESSLGQGLGVLVPVSCTPHGASTSGLSTLSSTGHLTWLTQWGVSS